MTTAALVTFSLSAFNTFNRSTFWNNFFFTNILFWFCHFYILQRSFLLYLDLFKNKQSLSYIFFMVFLLTQLNLFTTFFWTPSSLHDICIFSHISITCCPSFLTPFLAEILWTSLLSQPVLQNYLTASKSSPFLAFFKRNHWYWKFRFFCCFYLWWSGLNSHSHGLTMFACQYKGIYQLLHFSSQATNIVIIKMEKITLCNEL